MANRYWGGGAGTWSTTDTTHWYSDAALTTLAGAVPTAADSVFFQQASTYTVTMTGALLCLDITVSAGTVTFATGTSPTLTISGSMSLVAGTIWNSTGTITFNATTNKTISTGGTTINGAIIFNGVGGNWSLNSALTQGATLTTTLTAGTLTLNGFTLTTGIFSSSNTNTRAIAFGSNNIILAHTTLATNVLDMANINNFSYTGTGGFTTAMGITRTFTVGTTSAPGSVLFNGTTQYASITTAANGPLDLAAGAGNWTVEAWFYLTNTTADRPIFWKGGSTGSVNPSYAFWIQAGGTGQWIVGNGAGAGASQNLSGTFVAATWYHFALVRNGNTLTAYVNGVAQTPVTMTFTMSNTASNLLTIGSSAADGGTRFHAGNISNVRIVKGVAVYTGNFTPPISTLTPSQSSGTNISAITYSQTSLLLNTPNNTSFLLDSSINAYTVTNVATATAAATTPVTTVNGSVLTPPKLALTSGASIPTITTGSFLDTLNFTGSTSVPAVTTVYLKNLTLASGVAYANLTPVMAGTGSLNTAGNTTLTNLTVHSVVGTTTLAAALTTTATGTVTLTSGTLDLGGLTISCGIFSSTNTNTRAIAFGTSNITLAHTTAATAVLSMATLTNFSYTGTGGFTSAMGITRTFTCGTTGGTATTAPNLTLTSGASVATLTTASWFNKLDYGTTSFTQAAATLNVNSITLSTTGTYTALIINLRASGTVIYNGKTTAAVTLLDGSPTIADTVTCTTFTISGATFNFTSGTVNPSTSVVVTSGSFTLNGGTLGAVPTFTHTAGTVQFNSNYSLTATGTYTFTAGTLSINDGITLSTGIFSSTNTNTRTINFGLTTSPGWISLTHTTAATVVLSMAIVTGLTVNAKGKWDQTQPAQVFNPQQVAGGFQSLTTVTRTFTVGTTGGNSANAPCLYITGTGATQLPTFTTGSWFGDFRLDGLSAMTLGVSTLNINTFYSQGYFQTLITNSLSLNFVGSGFCRNDGDGITLTYGTLGTVTINHSGTTSLTYSICVATTVTFTSGTLECKAWANGPFNGYGSFFVTGAFTQTGGSWLNNAIYIPNCTTYTINGATVSFNSGSITPTTSVVLTSGSFTYNGGTLAAVPTFTHTAGTATFNYNYSLTTTGTYALAAGTLTLAPSVTLSTGIFSSTGAGTRAIGFGSNIVSSGSAAFNGIDQYLTVPSSTALTLGTGDFTIEAWINPITVDAGQNQFNIITLGNLQFFVSGGTLYFNDATQQISGGTVVINKWQHIALTRFGTLVTAYINGIPCISTTSNVDFVTATTLIGTNAEYGGTRAWGYISNLRVVKGLSVYTIAAFTPSTTALTAVTNTQLLVNAVSSGTYLVDGSTNNFTLTPTGTVTYDASTPIGSGGSLYFDQTTISYLTLPSSNAFNITGNFTIEAWIKPTTILAGENGILDTRVAGQSATPWIFYVDGNAKLSFFTGAYYTSTSSITANVWTHVAVVRSGATLSFFINGIQSGSTNIGTDAISPGTTSALIGTKDFGVNAQYRTIDYITNLRFVNGTALYTPNSDSFTPPTNTLASTQSANTNGNPSSAITGTQTSLLLNTVQGSSFLTDNSTYNVTVTNNGATTSSSLNPFTGFINLTHTTAATVVLNMAALGGFSWTGLGGFTVADMSNTRTFSVGNTSGGSTTTAPNLTFTTGASVATLTSGSWYNNLNFGTTSFNPGTTALNIDGNLTLSSSGTYTGLTPSILGTSTITTKGKTIVGLTIGSATLTGTATLADALTLSGALTLTQGTLSSDYNITSGSFVSAGALTKVMTGTNYTYTITGAGATAFSNTGTGLTISGFTISMTSASAKTFAGGSGTYSTLNQGGAGILTVSGNNSFTDITATTRPSTITFTAASTQTLGAFTLSGTSGNLVTINSSTAATRYNLSKASGIVSVNYLSIRDCNATGGASWYAGITSTNVSNNLGWIFTIPARIGDFFNFF